jgi:drug/metabolite transporter (DMT)-like permease
MDAPIDNISKNSSLGQGSPIEYASVTGYVLVSTAAMAYVLSCHLVSNLTKTVSSITISFYVGIFGSILSLIPMAIFERPTFPEGLCILFLMVHAFGTAQISLVVIIILKYISPTMWTLLNSLSLAITMIYQYTWLKPLHPGLGNWVEIMGAAVCFMCCITAPVWDLVRESRKITKEKTDGK